MPIKMWPQSSRGEGEDKALVVGPLKKILFAAFLPNLYFLSLYVDHGAYKE